MKKKQNCKAIPKSVLTENHTQFPKPQHHRLLCTTRWTVPMYVSTLYGIPRCRGEERPCPGKSIIT